VSISIRRRAGHPPGELGKETGVQFPTPSDAVCLERLLAVSTSASSESAFPGSAAAVCHASAAASDSDGNVTQVLFLAGGAEKSLVVLFVRGGSRFSQVHQVALTRLLRRVRALSGAGTLRCRERLDAVHVVVALGVDPLMAGWHADRDDEARPTSRVDQLT
jgi:hypothetical protein